MELTSQVYIPPSAVWKGVMVRMVSVPLIVTNTLDVMVVSDMVSEPFFQSAVVLQERTSDEPTVAW